MDKSTDFSGQPVFNHPIKLIDKSDMRKTAKYNGVERYIKKCTTYHLMVLMLSAALEGQIIIQSHPVTNFY